MPNVEEAANTLGSKLDSLRTSYLGLPLGFSYKAKVVWNYVVKRLQKTSGRRKKYFLSKGGRLTFSWTTLLSLLTYYMSCSLFQFIAKILEITKVGVG